MQQLSAGAISDQVIENLREKESNQKDWTIKRPNWLQAHLASHLISSHAEKTGTMVKRSTKVILQNHYLVALSLDLQVVGVIGFVNWSNEGMEIVSHLCRDDFRKIGLGKKLFLSLLEEIEKIQPLSLFLCTTSVEYYQKLGFTLVDPKKYTAKLRHDCLRCKNGPQGPGFAPCPEYAMEYPPKFYR